MVNVKYIKKYCLIPTITNNTEFRKDEELFYYTLKKVSELIDEIKPNCFVLMNEEAFFCNRIFFMNQKILGIIISKE